MNAPSSLPPGRPAQAPSRAATGLRAAAARGALLTGGLKESRLDEEQFAHDLALMLRSGLSLIEALRTVAERQSGGAAQAMNRLLEALRQGETLSTALQASGHFSTAMLACVKASELTGDLGDALTRYATNATRLRQLRSKLISACVYPALLVSVATLVVLFLLMYVVPRFALVLEGAARDMSPMSRLLIDVGMALSTVQGPLLATMLGSVGLLVWVLLRAARAGRLGSMMMNAAGRLPWLRGLVRTYGQAQLARTGAMLARSGVPALKALGMCRALLSAPDQPRLDRALAAATGGAPLAQSLHDSGLVDNLGLRVLRVAEQTGALDTALDRLADVHDAVVERALERLGRVIEPVLMLFIGGVVGGIVVLMYLPIFQLAASIR
ncbi:type II secretion system F family protein [Sphaerotilus mobilis]|uniref:General secretion pathway protein F n=1 Tax=Sphaerotilus mobilis TaxID=47994 RepID=A0A4Q7LUT4_9BURK|nr:type II secretion system F family protein [Sphaerotilus mobilis]RZS58012.1 general secretion pathway protein F [Sphaerotilus mobilis]